jgi:hypothetical protein
MMVCEESKIVVVNRFDDSLHGKTKV